MPPELTLALLGIALAAAAGVQQLIKAAVKRQVSNMEARADDALKDREAQRQREHEVDLQTRLRLEAELEKIKAETADNKAVGENLINLNATIIRIYDNLAQENFANREVLTNTVQTVGDLGESVDRVGTILESHTTAVRSTGMKVDTVSVKADAVVAAIEHLETIMNSGVREIKLLLTPPTPPMNVVNVNTAAPLDDLQKTG